MSERSLRPKQLHVLSQIKPYSKGFNEEEAIEKCAHFLTSHLALKTCSKPSGYSRRETQCTCLSFLVDDDDETAEVVQVVAQFMVQWAGLKFPAKKDLLEEWLVQGERFMKNSDESALVYLLPVSRLKRDITDKLICRNALCEILCISRRTLEGAYSDDVTPHGLVGKRGVKANWSKSFTEV